MIFHFLFSFYNFIRVKKLNVTKINIRLINGIRLALKFRTGFFVFFFFVEIINTYLR